MGPPRDCGRVSYIQNREERRTLTHLVCKLLQAESEVRGVSLLDWVQKNRWFPPSANVRKATTWVKTHRGGQRPRRVNLKQ